MRILLAYSGGLDTSYLAARLSSDGHEVICATVDCGGMDTQERDAIAARAIALGGTEHRFIDARAQLFDDVLRWLIAGNVRRGGTYPLSVAAERSLQAELLAELALEEGFDALAHGCTAAGNDQVRFEAALSICAPGLQVLAPVRDEMPSRDEQRAWLQEHGHQLPPSGTEYSVNAGLWGLTIGGGSLLESSEPLPEEAWCWTKGGAGHTKLDVQFEGGVPVSVDGAPMDPVPLIEALNQSGGQLGVGRGYHLGDTVLGIKGRIAYEAPAAEILLTAHRELEKLVLTEEQRFWKDHLADVYGRKLHQGLFHDPSLRDFEALFASTQAPVTGTVHISIADGKIMVTGLESPHSMMAASDAKYGERAATGTDPRGAVGLARILAEPGRLHRLASKKEEVHA
jgi:argininosuccinate synthase